MYDEEEEGGRRLDALTNHSSFWCSRLSHRTPQRGCDTITFLCGRSPSGVVGIVVPPEGSLEDLILLSWWITEVVGIWLLVLEPWCG